MVTVPIGIKVKGDPRGARVVRRSFDEIRRGAQSANRSLVKSERALNRFGNTAAVTAAKVNTVKTSMVGMAASARSLAAGLGIAAGVGGLLTFTKRALEATNQLRDTADKLGLTAKALQEFRFAAESVGVNSSTTDLALQRFTRRLGEARVGAGELRETLAQYGIALVDTNGRIRSAGEVFGDLADVISKTDDAQERLRISFKAFDSEGAALVNLLSQGRDGFSQLKAEADATGAIIGDKVVQQLADANTELAKAYRVINSQLTIALADAAPLLVDIAESFAGIAREVTNAITEIKEFNSELDEALGKPRPFDSINRAGLGANESFRAASGEQVVARSTKSRRGGDPISGGLLSTLPDDGGAGSSFQKQIEPLKRLNTELERNVGSSNNAAAAQGNWITVIEGAPPTLNKTNEELNGLDAALRKSGISAGSFGAQIGDIFGQMVAGSEQARQSVGSLEKQLLKLAVSQGIKALAFAILGPGPAGQFAGQAGSAFAGQALFSAQGNAFNKGRALAFAQGGVISSPTAFPLASGFGIAGEKGPEAILPLKRGPGGNLGVSASSAGTNVVNINIDVAGDATERTVQQMFEAAELVVQRNIPGIVSKATTNVQRQNRRNPSFLRR